MDDRVKVMVAWWLIVFVGFLLASIVGDLNPLASLGLIFLVALLCLFMVMGEENASDKPANGG